MNNLQKATQNNNGLILNIAINYSGRDEILRAIKKIAVNTKNGKIEPNEIDKKLFENYLDTTKQKDPDLIIRTAGNQRISNFLLWQIAYSELYFTETKWPDFTSIELKNILDKCKDRTRTFGTTNSLKLYSD